MLKKVLFAGVMSLGMVFAPIGTTSVVASTKIFDNMSGKWRGKGLVKATAKGKKESIRCRMKNTKSSDQRINLTGNCAVSGFVFSLRGYIEQDGSKNSYKASMFRSLANLKQSAFTGKRNGTKINFSFQARDSITKSNVTANIRLISKNEKAFDVHISRTDPTSGKIFDVGTIKFAKR